MGSITIRASERIARAVSEPDEGFTTFFRSEYPSLVRTLFLVVHDRELARDIAQDAFVQLFARWRRISHYERPEAWVRRVGIRMAVRASARERVRPRLERELDFATLPRPVDIDLVRAIGRLPASQRAAVALFYLEDRPGERGRRGPRLFRGDGQGASPSGAEAARRAARREGAGPGDAKMSLDERLRDGLEGLDALEAAPPDKRRRRRPRSRSTQPVESAARGRNDSVGCGRRGLGDDCADGVRGVARHRRRRSGPGTRGNGEAGDPRVWLRLGLQRRRDAPVRTRHRLGSGRRLRRGDGRLGADGLGRG